MFHHFQKGYKQGYKDAKRGKPPVRFCDPPEVTIIISEVSRDERKPPLVTQKSFKKDFGDAWERAVRRRQRRGF